MSLRKPVMPSERLTYEEELDVLAEARNIRRVLTKIHVWKWSCIFLSEAVKLILTLLTEYQIGADPGAVPFIMGYPLRQSGLQIMTIMLESYCMHKSPYEALILTANFRRRKHALRGASKAALAAATGLLFHFFGGGSTLGFEDLQHTYALRQYSVQFILIAAYEISDFVQLRKRL